MRETQILEDELKEVGELNSTPLAENKNLKLSWPKRARQKMVSIPLLQLMTMIKSHAGSTFYTLFSLSIRVLPSY
jgi:hypothetical protein